MTTLTPKDWRCAQVFYSLNSAGSTDQIGARSADRCQSPIPAAILALLVQFLFDFLDRLLIPQGLRLETRRQ